MSGRLDLNKSIHVLFEEQVSKYPNRIAAIYRDISITYEELNERANVVASHLIANGLKANAVVGLMLERSVDMIVSIMAILKAGGAYLPIDVHWPDERIKIVMENSDVSFILIKGKVLKIKMVLTEITYLDIDDMDSSLVLMQSPINNPEDVAYVLYTSGTTGTPKGVMIQHYSVINLVNGLYESIYCFEKDEINVALLAPIVFDASIKQIFPSLLLGHTLFIIPEILKLSPSKLVSFFKNNFIDITDITPTHLSLLNMLIQTDGNLGVKLLLVGGEPLYRKTYDDFNNKYGHYSRLVNVYGPTECCDVSTVFTLPKQLLYSEKQTTIPIGKPLGNIYLYILDTAGNESSKGEIYIGGLGVGKGYINNSHLTKIHFINNPFRKGEKMYKTGDVAKILADGTILFLGRIDNQVKINGYRIELKEIEHILNEHEQVQQVIVIEVDEEGGGKKLCAYYLAKEAIPEMELRIFLNVHLPSYMIPSYFVWLKHFPVNSNGKVDKKYMANYKSMLTNT